MNWRALNFDWNRARAFLVTAQEGSYSKAAKALHMSQPTLGRQVTALEKELGVILFERLGNSLKLTPSGESLLAHVKLMGEAATNLSLMAKGHTEDIEGDVCISATEVVAALVLAPLLSRLRQHAPGIRIEIIATNEASDLRKREADIAIRNFKPTHSELIAVPLTKGKAHLYASPDYLTQFTQPITSATLANASFVGFPDNAPYINELINVGLQVSATNFPYVTESHIVHWELVKAGAAIGIMPDFIGDNESRVIRVLPKMPAMEYDNWLVVHRELHTNRRVRLVFDFLKELLNKHF